ncbi:MAG TPA: phenylacetate--CoA ligase family protein [Methanomicrobia archaeon]|nr:phenylacetate--CoA ligase family protein [Methanomicrobia archaeon]HEX58728.1 phenylacetate--CoA ligase family protein [Methanomicrobia archaeon]
MGEERAYWNAIEKLPRTELEELKLKRLRAIVRYAYYNSPFYHRWFEEAGVKPDDIRSFKDLERIPVFRKDDIRAERDKTGDPFAGLLCVPLDEVLLINPSTGTTGIPTFVTYAETELKICAEMMCRHFWMTDARPGDKALTIQLNWHWLGPPSITAYRRLGMHLLVDFVHPITAERYVWLAGFKPDFMFMDQPLLMAIRDEIREHTGKEPHELYGGVRNLVCAGESFPPKFKEHLMQEFGITGGVYDLYGCSESHIVAVECSEHNGNHFWEDMFHVEILDPDSGEVIPPDSGESGEVVVTNLFARDMPFIRYGTEDVAYLETERCGCGRTHARLIPRDRISWRIKISGKEIYPIDVRRIVEEFPETVEGAFTIRKYAEEMPKLKIDMRHEPWVRPEDEEALARRICERIKEKLGVEAEIRWVSFSGLPVIFHKIERVLDETKR